MMGHFELQSSENHIYAATQLEFDGEALLN